MNLYIHTTDVSFNEYLERSTKIISPEYRISEIVSPISTYKNLTPNTTKYKCFTFNNINNKKIFKIYNNFFFKKKFKISNHVFFKEK